jgi:hypothetical protein
MAAAGDVLLSALLAAMLVPLPAAATSRGAFDGVPAAPAAATANAPAAATSRGAAPATAAATSPAAAAAMAATAVGMHGPIAIRIPPFSRRYRTGCSTCHVTPGKLNTQGEVFRINGYRFQDDDARLRHDQPVPLGAEPWKDLWPQAIWPGEIPGALPLSIHLVNDVRIGRTAERRIGTTFTFPAGLALQSATALGDGIAAFGEVTWRPGSGLQLGEVRAMLHDPLPFLPPRALNVWIGALQPHLLTLGDIGLDRAARQPFLWQRLRLADWPLRRDGETLAAESSFRLAAVRPAIELNGLAAGRLHYGLGLAQPAASGGGDGAATDLYLKVRLKLGGMALDGRTRGAEPPLAAASAPADGGAPARPPGDAGPRAWGGQFLDDGVILEHFSYSGESRLSGGAVDSHRSFGLAARVLAGRADIGIGHIWGRNANPWRIDGLGARHSSQYARGEYLLYPWLIGSLKADRTRFSVAGAGAAEIAADALERVRLLPGLVVLLRQNVRMVSEAELYVRDEPRSGPAGERAHAVWLRLDVAY